MYIPAILDDGRRLSSVRGSFDAFHFPYALCRPGCVRDAQHGLRLLGVLLEQDVAVQVVGVPPQEVEDPHS